MPSSRRPGSAAALSLAALSIAALWLAVVAAGEDPPAGAPPVGTPLDFQAIIAEAKRRVFPALVFVKPISESFSSGERTRQEVFGSGVIVRSDGLVVTNHHVVENAVQINCVLYNEKQVPARIVGIDPETDLAVLRLELPAAWKDTPLPTAEWGDAVAIQEGDFVMALGSPFGFSRSISLGIVSNTRRYIGFASRYKYSLWIQTDAAINPGNSGGPLVDTQGRIIGINTLGVDAAGIGFAIPAPTARRVAERILADGEYVRAWTGIEVQALNDFEHNTFFPAERGVKVAAVEPDSPADRAGVESGDLLLEAGGARVDGRYVEDLPGVRTVLADLPLGKPCRLQLLRGAAGESLAIDLTPERKGRLEGEDFDCVRWNMTVKEISRFGDSSIAFHKASGVFVRAVKRVGNAAEAGIASNDILVALDRQPVNSLADFRRLYESLLADSQREKKVLLEVLRRGNRRMLVLDYARDRKKEEEE